MQNKSIRKIVHFREKCIGCGMCSMEAHEYWEMSEKDGMSILIGAIKVKDTFQKDILPGDEEKNYRAAEGCPVNIIKIL